MGAWDGMDPAFAQRVQALISASGGLLAPGSGFRSHDAQTRLYNAWKAGTYHVPEVARPGTSRHERGLAMDLVDTSTGRAVQPGSAADKWLKAHVSQFGLEQLRSEAWHVQLADGQQGGMQGDFQYDRNLDDFTSYNMIWGQDMHDNPKDVLANRLHAVMRIIGGSPAEKENIQAATDPVTPDTSMAATPGTTPAPYSPPPTTRSPMPQGTFSEGAAGKAGIKAPTGSVNDPHGYGAFAQSLFGQYGWSPEDYRALVELWNRESGNPKAGGQSVTWNPNARNPASTAFGIAQFLNGTWAGTGIARTADPYDQMRAGAMYINSRYGNPRNALNFHNRNNWY